MQFASRLFAIAISALSVSLPSAIAQTYSITELGAGYTPYALNNLGEVVGRGPDSRAFLWSNGSTVSLPTLGGVFGRALAINDAHQIGGSATNAQGIARAVIWQNNQIFELDAPVGQSGDVRGINSNGDAVGNLAPGAGTVWVNRIAQQSYGAPTLNDINDAGMVVGETNYISNYLAENGNRITQGVPLNIPYGEATAVNTFGQVVGRMNIGGPFNAWRAYLWDNGSLTNLGALGGNSYAKAINDNGQIVGDGEGGGAFIWQNGFLQDLNGLIPTGTGWVLSTAMGINNSGQILGIGNKGGFLLTPIAAVPEPTIPGLLFSGLCVIGIAVRKRRLPANGLI